ncbi:hypothetical protein IPJ70_03325 [Candidatus Campbellbacteria bacterium]|nr:MAG: hypothetical protein IPJ70_03325 [Candidatus Campbellbacteria bacterium]
MMVITGQSFLVGEHEFVWSPPRYCQEFKRNVLGFWYGTPETTWVGLLRIYPYGESFRAFNLRTSEEMRDLNERALLEVLSRWLHEVEHQEKMAKARQRATLPEVRQASGIIA